MTTIKCHLVHPSFTLRKKSKSHPEVVDIAHQAQEKMDTLPRANLSAVSSASNLTELSPTVPRVRSPRMALSPLAATQRTITTSKQAFNTSKQALSNIGKQFAGKISLNKLKVGGGSSGNSRFMPTVWYSKVEEPEQSDSQLSLETARIGEVSVSSEGLSTLPRQYSNADIIDVLKNEETDGKDIEELLNDDDVVMVSCGVLRTDSQQLLRAISSTDFQKRNQENESTITPEQVTEALCRRRQANLGMSRVKSLDEYNVKRLSLPVKTNYKAAPTPAFFLGDDDEKLTIPSDSSQCSKSVGDVSIEIQSTDSDRLKPAVARQMSRSADDISSTQSQNLAATGPNPVAKSSESLIIVTDTEGKEQVAEPSAGGAVVPQHHPVHQTLSKSASAAPMPSQPDPDQTWVDSSATSLQTASQSNMVTSFSEGALANQMEGQGSGTSVNPFSKLKTKMTNLTLPASPQTRRKQITAYAKDKRKQSEQEHREYKTRIILL